MNGYSIKIKVQDGKVEEILQRLQQAQHTIYQCYRELEELGVVIIEKEKTASGN